MSIAGLIAKFGKTLYQYRPTVTRATDGQVVRTYSTIQATVVGFIQPSGQTTDPAQGRTNTRTQATIYLEGLVEVLADDEFYESNVGSTTAWRVVGATNPGYVGTTLAAPHLNMTVVQVVAVDPRVTAGIGGD